MKSKIAIVVLILVCLGLGVALVNEHRKHEKEKQELLWGAIDKSNLSDAEKVKISLILPYSPSDLK